MKFRVVGSRLAADLDFVQAEMLDVLSDDGETFTRLVIRHPGAAAIVLYDDGDIILLRQYRAPLGGYLTEIPAGKLDGDEDPEEAARREAAEETGWMPTTVRPLASIHTGPGFTDEIIHLFLGTGLEASTAKPDGPEERDAEVIRVPLTDVRDLIDQGHITDSKTVSGLLLAREVLT